jgi:hypothetical protein
MYFRFLLLYLKLVVKATCLFTYIKIYSFNWTNIIDLNKFLFRDWIYIVSWYQSINQSITYRTRDFWVQFFQMDITFFSFMCMFCISLFVLLYFFALPLCCLSFFDLRILISPLISSNSSSREVKRNCKLTCRNRKGS